LQKQENLDTRLCLAIKTKIEQLPIPEELHLKKEFTKKDIMISKMVSIKNELASMPPNEFKQLTDLTHNEQSCDQITKQIIEAVKKAKSEIVKERESSDFEKKMSQLKSEFDDY
jgi:hypothetical protein